MKRYTIGLTLLLALMNTGCEDKEEKDTIPPTVSIVKPNEGGILKGIVSVEVQAEDDDAIASVSISLNNEVDTTILQPPYSYSWDTNNNSDGEYALLAKALDASGNEGISTPIKVTVANQNKPTSKLFTQNHPLDGDVFRHMVLQVSNDIYFLGGFSSKSAYDPQKSFYKYNIDTKTWTQLADAPYSFPHMEGYVSQSSSIIHNSNKIYANSHDMGYAVYDISTNSWKDLVSNYNDKEYYIWRGDILTIGVNPYAFKISYSSDNNNAYLYNLLDRSLYKEKNGLPQYQGYRLFQYEYSNIQKHFFESDRGFFQINKNKPGTDANGNATNTDILIQLKTPPITTDENGNELDRRSLNYFSWKNYLLTTKNNSILVYDVETDIWKTIKLPDGENVTHRDNYLINVDNEQGLFAIITSWDNIASSSILYFNLTYESFSKLP